MGQNEEFINNLKMEDVPWNRLMTTYGCADEFPGYFRTLEEMSDLGDMKKAFGEIAENIEHQSTLWQATPFALIFLARIYREAVRQEEKKNAAWLVEKIGNFFYMILENCHELEEMMAEETVLPLFSDMLKEEYLFPEGLSKEEGEDWDAWEELWNGGSMDDVLASFYYYSYEVLKEFDQ